MSMPHVHAGPDAPHPLGLLQQPHSVRGLRRLRAQGAALRLLPGNRDEQRPGCSAEGEWQGGHAWGPVED